MRQSDLPGGAKLWIPDGFKPDADGTTDLTLHLHGGHEAFRKAFTESRRRGALVTLILPGLSGVYTKHFASDPAAVFFELLDAAKKPLGVSGWNSVWVSSFSAGFGGVRELLKAPPVYDRIDALILADTLYAGFAREMVGAERPEPNPKDIEGFVRYACDAAQKRNRAMLVTYCDLLPPTYAATRETADALRRAVGVENTPRNEEWTGDLTLTSHARLGRFATYGFSGNDGAAHMRHLHCIGLFYRLVPRA
jgi:hypothetical protein